jgi:hypothetical protein
VYLPTKLSFEFVELKWNLKCAANLLDWIGLFESG